MAVDCENQLIQEVRNTPYFAIQLDESTTVASEALLLVFVRYLNTNGNSLRSDLLHSVNLSTTTRGEDIFGQILDFFNLHELDFQKLVGCCSDGAASMMDIHKGFVARMKPIVPNCKFIHCFLHRQALAAKKLSPILNDVLSVCIKLVNFIKSRPLNNRLFSELCIDEEHKTLLLHTEVRWLSRGYVLGRLFELQNPVIEFLKDHDANNYLRYFESGDSNFLIYLAYLADIFAIYNTYNLRLQGQNITIIETVNSMNALRACLVHWIRKVKKNDFSMFPLLSEIVTDSAPPDCIETILAHVHNLEAEISQRFDEIKYANSLAWVIDPFSSETRRCFIYIKRSRRGINRLQTNTHAKQLFDKKGYICFWIEKNIIAKTLSSIALKECILPFATTYLAERAFSYVVTIKNKSRNRLDIHNDLRLAITNIKPNIELLANDTQGQGSH